MQTGNADGKIFNRREQRKRRFEIGSEGTSENSPAF
jgi:hypothetical protein